MFNERFHPACFFNFEIDNENEKIIADPYETLLPSVSHLAVSETADQT